jgi:ADP-ribosylation factor related protein 1
MLDPPYLLYLYREQCHAVVYMIDASNRDRLDEGWTVFGSFPMTEIPSFAEIREDDVLTSPQISGVPLLLLANKQDAPDSLTVEEIRETYEEWWNRKQTESHPRTPLSPFGGSEWHSGTGEEERRRMGSLDVMGVSALQGCVDVDFRSHNPS